MSGGRRNGKVPATMEKFQSTTVIGVLRDGRGAIGSDGQVTLGNTVVKGAAVKVRPVFNGQVLTGFAGGAADALTLFEKFEGYLERYGGHLQRATVELAREWRTDKMLRHLEAMLVVMDRNSQFVVSGNGDVIEADDGVVAVGSGAPYALAAARAMLRHTDLDAEAVCRESLKLAGEICIYTNENITVLGFADAPEGE